MAVKEEPQNPKVETDEITWRAEQFSGLGFGHDDSWTLAHTRCATGFYLYWYDVKKTLDAGAKHADIIDWFTYPVEPEVAVA